MDLTRSQVLRAAPVVGANLVPLFGVVFLGWKVVAVYILFWIETVIVIFVDAARRMSGQGPLARRLDALGESFILVAVCNLFALGQLMFVIFALGKTEWNAMTLSDNPFRDLAAFIAKFELGYAATLLAAVHIAGFVRERRRHPRLMVGEAAPTRSFLRLIGLNLILIIALAPTFVFGTSSWALVVIVVMKAALEILLEEVAPG